MSLNFNLQKSDSLHKKEKFGVTFTIYPDFNNLGLVHVNTTTGHNQEFYHAKSTFTYLVLDGSGSFFLNDKEVQVSKGDLLTIEPNTRIYYKGKLEMILTTSPAWTADDEVETKANIW